MYGDAVEISDKENTQHRRRIGMGRKTEFVLSNRDAITRAVESVRQNMRLSGASPDTFPHVLEGTIRAKITGRSPSGAVEVTVSFRVESGPECPSEKRGSLFWFGPPCEGCSGTSWVSIDGKKRGCEACGGTGIRRRAIRGAPYTRR